MKAQFTFHLPLKHRKFIILVFGLAVLINLGLIIQAPQTVLLTRVLNIALIALLLPLLEELIRGLVTQDTLLLGLLHSLALWLSLTSLATLVVLLHPTLNGKGRSESEREGEKQKGCQSRRQRSKERGEGSRSKCWQGYCQVCAAPCSHWVRALRNSQ